MNQRYCVVPGSMTQDTIYDTSTGRYARYYYVASYHDTYVRQDPTSVKFSYDIFDHILKTIIYQSDPVRLEGC